MPWATDIPSRRGSSLNICGYELLSQEWVWMRAEKSQQHKALSQSLGLLPEIILRRWLEDDEDTPRISHVFRDILTVYVCDGGGLNLALRELIIENLNDLFRKIVDSNNDKLLALSNAKELVISTLIGPECIKIYPITTLDALEFRMDKDNLLDDRKIGLTLWWRPESLAMSSPAREHLDCLISRGTLNFRGLWFMIQLRRDGQISSWQKTPKYKNCMVLDVLETRTSLAHARGRYTQDVVHC